MIFRGKKESAVTETREPREASDGAIKFLRQIASLSRLSILDEEPPFIGFEAGTRLRSPGEIFSVRRIERRGVRAGTGGNFLRVARASGLRV